MMRTVERLQKISKNIFAELLLSGSEVLELRLSGSEVFARSVDTGQNKIKKCF